MTDIIYIFSVYSVFGWIVEVIFFFLKTGKYIRRGILHGAYCPLYGFSLAVCTLLSNSLNGSFFLTFMSCAAICTAFELITAIIFDKLLLHKMWDYSDNFMNLNGYICPGFSIIWGIVAALCIKYLNPILLSNDFSIKTVFGIALSTLIIADVFSFVKSR